MLRSGKIQWNFFSLVFFVLAVRGGVHVMESTKSAASPDGDELSGS